MSESREQVLITRRTLLRRSLTLSVGVAAAAVLGAACKGTPKELVCTDTVGLPPVDIQTRKALEYVDKSPDPQKACASCAQYVGAPVGSCAGCKMFKGPVNPKGYCKAWASKEAAPAASSG